jgi:hypothetical protein
VSRFKLLLIFALFAAPIVASYLVFYLWPPKARMNYGELIKQVALSDGNPQAGCDISSAEFKKKWTMIYIGGGACNSDCRKMLYYMRQVRAAQGAEQDRVERLWIDNDGIEPQKELLDQYPGMDLRICRDKGFLAQFAGGNAGTHVYMVDPLGNLMMRFPANPEPSRMIKDIKHLLKVSQIG